MKQKKNVSTRHKCSVKLLISAHERLLRNVIGGGDRYSGIFVSIHSAEFRWNHNWVSARHSSPAFAINISAIISFVCDGFVCENIQKIVFGAVAYEFL